ncbi:MAG: phage Gp37/Gp68 family protein [Defluviitaleaceae bacterium]|nr:phage Gp37/Gp68 family protein [Defluviitaleaceae bacterium]
MNKSDIEWCDRTWNPVTGCLHGCEYCYARGITNRFEGFDCETNVHHLETMDCVRLDTNPGLHELYKPLHKTCKDGKRRVAPFPYGFQPTFHRYRLDEPAKIKTPQTIFVGSTCDIFREWTPDEWIQEVFKACEAAPWHRYLFLTKNPKRYLDLADKGILKPQMVKLLNEAPTVSAWTKINSAEDLPPTDTSVLIYTKRDVYTLGRLNKNKKYFAALLGERHSVSNIAYWQPLPHPPEMEEK